MPLPPKLERELETLRNEWDLSVAEDGPYINLIFRNFPTGQAFNSEHATVLVRVPRGYPDAGPDMFWTNPTLTLKNGSNPEAADGMEIYGGEQWRRFSWHHSRWDSARENITSYLQFISRRFEQ